jgi:hypothetical protein
VRGYDEGGFAYGNAIYDSRTCGWRYSKLILQTLHRQRPDISISYKVRTSHLSRYEICGCHCSCMLSPDTFLGEDLRNNVEIAGDQE